MGWAMLFVLACVLASIAASLGFVFWFAKEAASRIAGWFLNWDREPRE